MPVLEHPLHEPLQVAAPAVAGQHADHGHAAAVDLTTRHAETEGERPGGAHDIVVFAGEEESFRVEDRREPRHLVVVDRPAEGGRARPQEEPELVGPARPDVTHY